MAYKGGGGPKKNILDLNKYLNQSIRVKFTGGREVIGVLKGFDTLLNLVVDEAKEMLRDDNDQYRQTGESRDLGLCVCRGTAVILISPMEGSQEIENPFLQAEQPVI